MYKYGNEDIDLWEPPSKPCSKCGRERRAGGECLHCPADADGLMTSMLETRLIASGRYLNKMMSVNVAPDPEHGDAIIESMHQDLNLLAHGETDAQDLSGS